MQIEVDRLTEAGESFAHTFAPEELSLEEERARLAAAAHVTGRASRKGEQVHLDGKITTTVEVLCDRCLRPVEMPVEVDFDVTYIPAGAEGRIVEEEAELDERDLGLSVIGGETVRLDELAREQILLALPTRLLCREDCKGLCQQCGADLNESACDCPGAGTDPRWGALAALKRQGE